MGMMSQEGGVLTGNTNRKQLSFGRRDSGAGGLGVGTLW